MTHPDDDAATTAEEAALEARLRQALAASTARPSAATREAILGQARDLAVARAAADPAMRGAADADGPGRPAVAAQVTGNEPVTGAAQGAAPIAAVPMRRSPGWRVPLGAALAASVAIAVVWPLVPVRAPQPATAVLPDTARPTQAHEVRLAPSGDAVAPAAEVVSDKASAIASVSRPTARAAPPPASPPMPPMPEAAPASGGVDASARFVPAPDPPGPRAAEPAPAPAGAALPAAAAGAAARVLARQPAADRSPGVPVSNAERAALPAAIGLACQPLAAGTAGDGRPGGAMHLRIETGAGRYSRDGGRTWQPVVAAAGARYVLSRRALAGGGTAVETLDLGSLTWEEVVDGATGPAVASRAACAEVAIR